MAETSGVALSIPTVLPDGTQILSGPVPGGQIASGMTQVTAKPATEDPLIFSGMAGGMFTIYGANFGPVGMVHVGQQQVTVTSWQNYRIKGLLPLGLDVKQDVTVTDGALKKTVIAYKAPAPLQPAAVPEPALVKK